LGLCHYLPLQKFICQTYPEIVPFQVSDLPGLGPF
jgi:hypothetical protein